MPKTYKALFYEVTSLNAHSRLSTISPIKLELRDADNNGSIETSFSASNLSNGKSPTLDTIGGSPIEYISTPDYFTVNIDGSLKVITGVSFSYTDVNTDQIRHVFTPVDGSILVDATFIWRSSPTWVQHKSIPTVSLKALNPPCFTPGTLVATPGGERLVEKLKIGDRVITRDNGIQKICWIGRRDLKGIELAQAPKLCPILIRQGALGNNLPEWDIVVSPNHRVMISSEKSVLYFEDREVLVAAKYLVDLAGVERMEPNGVSYIHFMFEHHELVLSHGLWTESFQPGALSVQGLDDAQRGELFELFPELETEQGQRSYGAARRSLRKFEAQVLLDKVAS
ncbi:Hint domain-containing protein [Shimia marina]|uniref:Hedgehog/Intein (Hint) domain-containing protein n=1 Tax=Shimia marina TaxID=321267 RepID=A0A0P1ERM7_9RHOB|nr:Hint domain-containing protein [Shimia marina]CUH52688.1 hypothetical protein SHM7688_02135 [Shimia marina]SFE75409.1 Hint domain-containing protein [Shimia marina]